MDWRLQIVLDWLHWTELDRFASDQRLRIGLYRILFGLDCMVLIGMVWIRLSWVLWIGLYLTESRELDCVEWSVWGFII